MLYPGWNNTGRASHAHLLLPDIWKCRKCHCPFKYQNMHVFIWRIQKWLSRRSMQHLYFIPKLFCVGVMTESTVCSHLHRPALSCGDREERQKGPQNVVIMELVLLPFSWLSCHMILVIVQKMTPRQKKEEEKSTKFSYLCHVSPLKYFLVNRWIN